MVVVIPTTAAYLLLLHTYYCCIPTTAACLYLVIAMVIVIPTTAAYLLPVRAQGWATVGCGPYVFILALCSPPPRSVKNVERVQNGRRPITACLFLIAIAYAAVVGMQQLYAAVVGRPYYHYCYYVCSSR